MDSSFPLGYGCWTPILRLPKKVMAGKPEIVILAAMAGNRVIGRAGAIPWRLPRDLARFRQRTMGHVVIMGRKTWESIGRPLPGRRIVVLSRNPAFVAGPGVVTATSLEAAIGAHRDEPVLFIAGGEAVYREALELADRVELSVLDRDVAGDAVFPEPPADRFRLQARYRMADEEPFTLCVYVRRRRTPPILRFFDAFWGS